MAGKVGHAVFQDCKVNILILIAYTSVQYEWMDLVASDVTVAVPYPVLVIKTRKSTAEAACEVCCYVWLQSDCEMGGF